MTFYVFSCEICQMSNCTKQFVLKFPLKPLFEVNYSLIKWWLNICISFNGRKLPYFEPEWAEI